MKKNAIEVNSVLSEISLLLVDYICEHKITHLNCLIDISEITYDSPVVLQPLIKNNEEESWAAGILLTVQQDNEMVEVNYYSFKNKQNDW